ncbi:hypothetical protein [Streptomyces sp. NBC_01803]|uniref:hypothetical protein n=1 Tax=Streptomyces sp. NBC_01803 TaxID=2975946 RepID=UPI002DD89F8E|nr:hypothetical protein [Streptomyces sp. NBC_01803]WSA43046.1 hypothetical protein OIE51_01850 [Streptomyces sp. NBC_01803]
MHATTVMPSPSALPTAQRPFVLGLFTADPSPAGQDRHPLSKPRFDPVRQVSVLADGTPRVSTLWADPTKTHAVRGHRGELESLIL